MLLLPDGLPLPVADGYGFKPVSPIVRTTMASGRAMQRRRFGSVPTILRVSWILSTEEAKLFEGWCKWEIGWADWFLCPIRTPLGLRPTRSRFTDIYEGPEFASDDLWRYTASLELFELPIVDEAAFAELLLGMPLPVMNAALTAELMRWYTKSWPGAQIN
ncbi:hypothetical protein MBA34_07005 [Pseudomonas capeferrum]|uniref:hypothetical protein n=1 Tax=Pseudomonas capeferrum TaxID=1495066 RepID=UPI0004DAE962|nr:hypothetical protein [Pseudomonas capeferrum]KEY88677.1 hypothetical protein PC358_05965 [Pseudomonas capeferrum]MCH7298795.1 hypothetical protein [Pseudomonas capeferrum]